MAFFRKEIAKMRFEMARAIEKNLLFKSENLISLSLFSNES